MMLRTEVRGGVLGARAATNGGNPNTTNTTKTVFDFELWIFFVFSNI
jgi:hypothetical protein